MLSAGNIPATTYARTEFVRAQFPDVKVPLHIIFEVFQNLQEEKICENCDGCKCLKKVRAGFQMQTSEVNGELDIRYKRCPYSKNMAWRKLSHIPTMYAGKNFEDYRVDEANINAVKWAKRLENLYLYGVPGCGKTFLASIMAQEFLKQGHSVIFNDVPNLLDKLKATFDKESDSTLDSLMEKLASVDVLVLDDMGVEMATEWAIERLYLIVNARYVAGKKLIVTSNYDLDGLENRLNNPRNAPPCVTGSRIVSRIRGLCKITPIFGSDRRRA